MRGVILVTILLITSLAAPFAGAVVANDGPGNSGLEATPSENFEVIDRGGGPPDHALENIPKHAAAWDVHSSAHSDDLEMTVDVTGDELRLTFADYRNHDGREVAVSADALEESLGERPTVAFGEHSSGDSWTTEIEYRDGMAVMYIDRFSENEVTFSGTVSLTGSPADDGTSYSYELADSEAVDNMEVTLEGVENREQQSTVSDQVESGESVPFDIAGTTNPETASVTISGTVPNDIGSVNFDESIGSAVMDTVHVDGTLFVAGSDQVVAIDVGTGEELWTAPFASGNVRSLTHLNGGIYVGDGDSITEVDATDGQKGWSVSHGGTVLSMESGDGAIFAGDGWSRVYRIDPVDGSQEWMHDQKSGSSHIGYDPGENAVYAAVDQSNGEIEKLSAADGSVEWGTDDGFDHSPTGVAIGDGSVYLTSWNEEVISVEASTGNLEWVEKISGSKGNDIAYHSDGYVAVAVDANQIRLFEVRDSEGTNSYSFDHANDAMSVSIVGNTVYSGSKDNDIKGWKFATESESPTVEIDGSTVVSTDGRLVTGDSVTETVSLSLGEGEMDVSALGGTAVDVSLDREEITETVDPTISVNGDEYRHFGTLADGETTELDVSEVSLANGENVVDVTVSDDYDGPIGQVGLDYSHAAIDQQTVDYEGEKFSERYDVSKTYANDQTDATLTVPFSGNVVGIRELEVREDGGNWTTAAAGDYSLSATELVVALGEVSEGTTVDVRTTGSKVQTSGGEISVLQATALEDDLSSEIRIEDHSSDFSIDVSETVDADELFHSYSESWTGGPAFARIDSDGAQELRMPDAGSGETTRLGTIPLEVAPANGHIDIEVHSASSEPEFEVLESSDTSEVEYTLTDTNSGHFYQLYSLNADAELDRAQASSPVTLVHDGSAELLRINDIGSSGSGSGGAAGASASGPGLGTIWLMLGVVASLGMLYLVSWRTGDETISGRFLVGVGAVLMLVITFMSAAPNVIGRQIAAGIGEAMPLLILSIVGLIVAYLWLRGRGGDEIIIQGDRQ